MRSLTVLILWCLCFVPLITCTETEHAVEQHQQLQQQQQQHQHHEQQHHDLIALEAGTSVDTKQQMESLMLTDSDMDMDTDADLDTDIDIDIDTETDIDTDADTSSSHHLSSSMDTSSSITLDHSTQVDDQSVDAMLENANEALLEMNAQSETETEHTLNGELDTQAQIDSDASLDSESDSDLSIDSETDAEMTMETDIEHEMEAFINSETDSEITSETELEIQSETGVDTDVDVEYYNSTHRMNGRTRQIPALSWGRALFMNGRYVGRLPGGVTPLWIPLRGQEMTRKFSRGGPRHMPKTMNLVLTTIPTRHQKSRYDFLKWVANTHRRQSTRVTIQILEFGITRETRNKLKLLTFHRTQLISIRWPGHRIAHNDVPRGFRHLKTFPQFKIKSRYLEIEVSDRRVDKAGRKHIALVTSSRVPIWPRTSLSLVVRGEYDSRAFPISLERTPTSPSPRVTALEYSFARHHRFQLWLTRYEQRHGRLPRALYNRLKYKFEQSEYWIQHKQQGHGIVHPLQNITIIGTVAYRLITTLGEDLFIKSNGPLKDIFLQYTYEAPGTLISIQAQQISLYTAVVAELGKGRAGINLSIGYRRARIRRSQEIRDIPIKPKKPKKPIKRVKPTQPPKPLIKKVKKVIKKIVKKPAKKVKKIQKKVVKKVKSLVQKLKDKKEDMKQKKLIKKQQKPAKKELKKQQGKSKSPLKKLFGRNKKE